MSFTFNDCAGEWKGTTRLYLSWPPEREDVSESRLEARVELGGLALSVRYTWAFEGRPQEGLMVVTLDRKTGQATGAWADTFHQQPALMALAGALQEDGVSMRGEYAAPEGPPWGWRIALRWQGGEELLLEMDNITPEGEAAPAVRAEYRREREQSQ